MSVPAIVFLAAALACSFIGRVLLVNVAFKVSTGWGFTVLFVPFGPVIFRFKYRDLAYPTRHWRMAVWPLMLLFFVNGGTASVQKSLSPLGKPKPMEASVDNRGFHLPVPSKVVAAAVKDVDHSDPTAEAPLEKSAPSSATLSARVVAAAAPPTPAPAGAPAAVATADTSTTSAAAATLAAPATAATPVPAATSSKTVATATAPAVAITPAPKVLSTGERLDANRRELDRLAVWYDSLRHERGYLRKGDTEAIQAFNTQAAQYQTALQLARTEQAELTRLTAKK